MTDTADALLQLLRSDGVVHSPCATLTPLSGGVSSEIYRVDDGGEPFVIKRALPKLKVQDDWTADPSRNVYERRYLEYVGRFLPRSVPALWKADSAKGYFVMEYLGPEYCNWKELLLHGSFEPSHARAAARTLSHIHRHSSGDPEAAALFDSHTCFHQLRLEPYLLTTGWRHPQLEDLFQAEAHRLAATSECLVHGDFSPKNILIGGNRMVILDCEVAWYGDPAFDVCFMLSHLFLKSLFHSGAEGSAQLIRTFWQEYSQPDGCMLGQRVPCLLLMLLLARIDGKSPVEYLTQTQREFVRRFVCARLPQPATSLSALSDAWFSEIADNRREKMKISSVSAWQIFDSRGIPTLEAEVLLENGVRGRGAVPSGASTGQFEAIELRDRISNRFRGKSVFQAIANIEGEIARCIRGCDVFDQTGLDHCLIELDGTPAKSRLGANAILAVSMAAARAAAAARNVSLYVSLGESRGDLIPLPEIQIVGGGLHANRRMDIQDFLFVPHGAQSYTAALEMVHNVYHSAGDLLRKRGIYYGTADEGGYWPQFNTNEAVLQFVVEAIENAGYEPGRDGSIALDVAASNLLDHSGRYVFHLEDRQFTNQEFAELLIGWCRRYPIVSVEDPMADTDLEGWGIFSRALGDRLQIIADDLVATNVARLREAINRHVANAVLIKLNQVGTVTETLAAIALAQEAGWKPVISARSGETEDNFIAHLAVATNAGQLKVGSFARSERTAKWNELIRIERELGHRARYAGGSLTLG